MICAKNAIGVKIFKPCSCWFHLCAADSSLSKSGMSVVSIALSVSSSDSSCDS